MKISMVPVGIVKKYMRELELDVSADITSGKLIERLNLPDKIKTVCFINGKRIDPDGRFTEGDVVKIVSTFTGG
ncbi:MAG: hypothetical protein R6V76_11590 [Desulfobacterales bacterium]